MCELEEVHYKAPRHLESVRVECDYLEGQDGVPNINKTVNTVVRSISQVLRCLKMSQVPTDLCLIVRLHVVDIACSFDIRTDDYRNPRIRALTNQFRSFLNHAYEQRSTEFGAADKPRFVHLTIQDHNTPLSLEAPLSTGWEFN